MMAKQVEIYDSTPSMAILAEFIVPNVRFRDARGELDTLLANLVRICHLDLRIAEVVLRLIE